MTPPQVRKQMMVKHAELAALWKAEKPDQAAITAKQKELKALWGQMKEKRTAFLAEARKISPELAKGFGRGMGRGMGHGGGMGPGGCPMVGPGGPAPVAPRLPRSGQIRNSPCSTYSPPDGEGLPNRPLTFFRLSRPRITPRHHPSGPQIWSPRTVSS